MPFPFPFAGSLRWKRGVRWTPPPYRGSWSTHLKLPNCQRAIVSRKVRLKNRIRAQLEHQASRFPKRLRLAPRLRPGAHPPPAPTGPQASSHTLHTRAVSQLASAHLPTKSHRVYALSILLSCSPLLSHTEHAAIRLLAQCAARSACPATHLVAGHRPPSRLGTRRWPLATRPPATSPSCSHSSRGVRHILGPLRPIRAASAFRSRQPLTSSSHPSSSWPPWPPPPPPWLSSPHPPPPPASGPP
mmetsp:Transcript_8701/g.20887  ORF Transcript_8701/g.20887 Transcript_8701/m.20887 type:complete len:244 (-) Transcript_8701:1345-2076(-)